MEIKKIIFALIVAIAILAPVVNARFGLFALPLAVGQMFGRLFHSIYSVFSDAPDKPLENNVERTRKAPAFVSKYGRQADGSQISRST